MKNQQFPGPVNRTGRASQIRPIAQRTEEAHEQEQTSDAVHGQYSSMRHAGYAASPTRRANRTSISRHFRSLQNQKPRIFLKLERGRYHRQEDLKSYAHIRAVLSADDPCVQRVQDIAHDQTAWLTDYYRLYVRIFESRNHQQRASAV